MTTLKEHEARLREREGASPFPSLIVTALIDILAHLNATTAPNNNDALLAQDLKACALQNASEMARIKELELLLRHETQQRLTLEWTVRDLRTAVNYWRNKAEELPEQAGCRKPDTQISPCEHEWKDTGRELYCEKCKVHPSDLPQTANDGWIEWCGGECPVAGIKMVEVRFRDMGDDLKGLADSWYWFNHGIGRDIIAYRVVKP